MPVPLHVGVVDRKRCGRVQGFVLQMPELVVPPDQAIECALQKVFGCKGEVDLFLYTEELPVVWPFPGHKGGLDCPPSCCYFRKGRMVKKRIEIIIDGVTS